MGLLSSGGCSEEEANHPWVKNPLKMEVKSVLDPCEDDNEGLQDDMSDDEMQNNDYYDTDSEVDHTQGQGDQYIVAPIEKQQEQEDNGKIDEDLFDNNKMASDLNSGLSKKTNVFGLNAWVLMVIVVGLFIIIILVVLSICLALRKKSRRGKGGMLPLGHILSISEEIKEISVDQVSSNNHPQNGSFMSLNDKFSDGDSRKVLIQTKNGDNSSQSGSFNRLEKDLNGSQSGDDNGGFRSISAYRSSSHPISASSPCSGLPEFSHLGWGHWFALRDLELTLLLEKVVMELSIEVNLSTGTLWPLRNSSIICILEEEKKRLLHCVVIGGGPTGVEFSGELSDFITRDVRERYTHVKGYIHVTLIEENEILSSFDVGLQQYATNLLPKSGVYLMRGVVKEVHPQKIILSDRTEVPYGLLVWSTGVGPSEFVKKLNLPSSPGGRIGVDGWMRVQSVKDVFALGDCAGFLEQTGRPVLPTLAKLSLIIYDVLSVHMDKVIKKKPKLS